MAEKKKTTSQAKAKVAAAKARAAQKAKTNFAVGAVNKQATGFIDFVRTRGIIGMAIGLAVGTVASGTIKTIVEGFVTPLVNFIVGTQDKLEAQVWHVELWGREANFMWGSATSALITLIATIFVIYVVVTFAKLDKIDKKD